MTPGTLVLLHPPLARATTWGALPATLRAAGLATVVPDVPDATGMAYVARASLEIAAADPAGPLVLVAQGEAGPLVPAIALAQRAAHRGIGAYVFLDAALPRTPRLHDHDHEEPAVAVPPDWPEAPCGYLTTGEAPAQPVREARLRGWPVQEGTPAEALPALITAL
ncbi:hypothetical protein [Spirillospora sp. NPDC029432]|uniref:hypothetical protein n=1 Tax=Spirillospora sp. NPDC029432 TaxID=3154599 RepID=UPI00345664D8